MRRCARNVSVHRPRGLPACSFSRPGELAEYDAPVISPRVGTPRQLAAFACTVAALTVVTLGWFGAQTVRPDCVVAISRLADSNGQARPDADGRVWTETELVDRAYQQAVDSGRCEPPRARWEQWIG